MMLLDSSLRATAVVGLIALLLAALRVRTSAVRHAAWTAALAGMLLMPVLSGVVPPVDIPLPARTLAPLALEPAIQRSETAPALPVRTTTAAGLPSTRIDSGSGGNARPPAAPVFTPERSRELLGLYLVVCIALLIRLGIGWRRARGISWRSSPIGGFFESPLVAAPVTIGVFAPRIVLPLCWREWSAATLRAVLLHERTHIQRRDPLITLLARVNCCIFWFHPLAWWLERTLAVTAEHACDDEAARALKDPRAYAKVLIDQADAVRRHGRLAWQGVGMHGAGLLQERVDRLLQSSHLHRMSRQRKLAIGISCATTIVLVAACRDRTAPVPLREDPEFAQNLAAQKPNREFSKAAIDMTPARVADLEASLLQNPQDLDARKRLLYYYRWSGKVRWEDKLAARRRHLLWLIEHHPEHQLTSEWGAISPVHDPEGAARARALWLAKTSRPDTPVIVLVRAASYFESHDKALAEQMLLRASAADPDGRTLAPESSAWSARLGRLYARAIVGSTDPTTFTPDPAAARSPFALEARKKLDASRDAEMLAIAGSVLATRGNNMKLDFDPVALGRSYLQRAIEVDPQQAHARRVLADADYRSTTSPIRNRVRAKQIELAGGEIARKSAAGERLTDAEQRTLKGFEFDAALTLSAPERLAVLPDLADEAYMGAESVLHSRKDQATANERWALSRKLAKEALALAEKFPQDPDYGTVIYRSKVTLATHALREGDKRQAVRYMLEAVQAPRSQRLATTHIFGLDGRLVNYLLKAGERDSVIRFLEQSADLRDVEREWLLKDAATLRRGIMPMSYQSMVTRNSTDSR